MYVCICYDIDVVGDEQRRHLEKILISPPNSLLPMLSTNNSYLSLSCCLFVCII